MNDTKNSPPPSARSPQERTRRSGLGFSIALAGLMVVLLVAVAVGVPRLLTVVNPPSQLAALSPKAVEMAQQRAERRIREATQLDSYGWIDKNAGVARIPIEQAITLIAAQGLPVGAPVADPSIAISQSSPVTTTTPAVDLSHLTYQGDILPIFEQHCGKCHGTDNPEEGLTLTTYKAAMNGSQYGKVILPGDPDKSYLVEMITTGKMPKRGGPMAQADINRIVAWIKAGAPEGDGSSSAVAGTTPISESTQLTETNALTATASIPSTEPATHTVDLANVSFTNDVLPIFIAHCSKCHGDDQPEEGLELTSYKKIMNGSLNGGVIKKGDPDNSYLVEMIVKGKMPKRGGPLAQGDIDMIIAWIKAGALDDTGIAASTASTATVAVEPAATITTTEKATATTIATATVGNTPTPTATATPSPSATEAITASLSVTTSATVSESSGLSMTEPATHTVDLTNVSFTNDVLPIFIAHCSKCHGDDQPEEGLELTSYKKIMNGSLNGGVIKKGDPDNSYLVEMITTGKMPKRGGPLAQSDIDTIIAWIKAGALDDTGTATGAAVPTGVGSSTQLTSTQELTSTDSLSPTEALTSTSVVPGTATSDSATLSFANDVLPIFQMYCFKCHADDYPEEGLELISYKKVMSGSIYGKVIAPGDPEKSYLVEMITTGKMPKRGGPLPQEKIDMIIAWIKAGALDN